MEKKIGKINKCQKSFIIYMLRKLIKPGRTIKKRENYKLQYSKWEWEYYLKTDKDTIRKLYLRPLNLMNIINLNKIFANYSTSLFGQTLFTFNKGIKVRNWEKQTKKWKQKRNAFQHRILEKQVFCMKERKKKWTSTLYLTSYKTIYLKLIIDKPKHES